MKPEFVIVRNDDAASGSTVRQKGILHKTSSGRVNMYPTLAKAEDVAVSLCEEYERSYFVCKTVSYVEPERVPVYITKIK